MEAPLYLPVLKSLFSFPECYYTITMDACIHKK